MYRTLLLMMCSTSSTFANLNDQINIITSPKTLNIKENVNSGKRKTQNKTGLSNNTTVTDINVDPTQQIDVTTLNATMISSTEKSNILLKIHKTITRSKDAVWATISLTFICVLLLLAVAQSKMWKDYRIPESEGVPLPDFNERVLFRDVMEHKINSLKQIFKKQKKKNTTELESLLPTSEWDGEETDIP